MDSQFLDTPICADGSPLQNTLNTKQIRGNASHAIMQLKEQLSIINVAIFVIFHHCITTNFIGSTHPSREREENIKFD